MNYRAGSLLVFVFLSGCAGFRQSRLPDVSRDENVHGASGQNAAAGRRLLYVSTGWKFERNGEPVSKDNFSQYQAYAESPQTIPNIFKESSAWQVVRDSAVADVDVDLQIKFKQETKFGNMFVTMATLLVFPYVGSSRHEIHVVATNRAGTTLLDETLEDGVNEWLEILLLPIVPFSSPHGAEQRSFENTLRTASLHLEQAINNSAEESRAPK